MFTEQTTYINYQVQRTTTDDPDLVGGTYDFYHSFAVVVTRCLARSWKAQRKLSDVPGR